MKLIDRINSSASQRMILVGNPGQRIVMRLRYMPSQQLWYADFEYLDFVLNGVSVVNSPNLLRAYKNVIPFGMLCVTDNGLDPYTVDAFDLQNARLYLLSETEVTEIEEGYFL